MRRKERREREEAKMRFLQDAITCIGHNLPGCKTVSSVIVHAMKPAWVKGRTEGMLFGVCEVHITHRQGWEADLADMGYESIAAVDWDRAGEYLDSMMDAGLAIRASA